MRRHLLLTVVMLLTGCAGTRSVGGFLPLPRLESEPIELRVAYVINSRLPRVDYAQLEAMLERARRGFKESFGREIRFTSPDIFAIENLFERFPRAAAMEFEKGIFDFKNGTGDRALLVRTFTADLRRTGDNLDEMIAYARPFLIKEPAARSFEALTEALVDTQLTRLNNWRSARTTGGEPLIDEMPYNEFIYWDSIEFAAFPYEVVITNQLIASAEYRDSSVHSALRGGISNGITTRNLQTRYGTTSIVSTYPFIGEDPWTSELRAGDSYSAVDAARFSGFLLVHELGHQLFHLGHPFANAACVMNPVQLLRFRAWVAGFSPKDCPFADSGAMKPGFARFPMPEMR